VGGGLEGDQAVEVGKAEEGLVLMGGFVGCAAEGGDIA